ncbi:hypothetical protein [Bacillus badius]|uniref:Uncharacterized protein n=1 Tax=Bacillus badius TaxID=1455 RepID=A0ABR5ANJ8_BACBA|nr:hypothetical protein [Bacillus badius]KIL72124.1 hypothetical protein SD77_3527 [Bacillus badius]MED4718624.1 hypothetical protein [Bacillus badius]
MIDKERFRDILNRYGRLNEIEEADLLFVFNYAEQQQQEIEELQASCRMKQGHINHIPVIRKEYEQQLQQAQKKIKQYEKTLSTIANIDTSFMNGWGDMEGYSEKEELRRIHEIVTPLWNEMVEENRKKGRNNHV